MTAIRCGPDAHPPFVLYALRLLERKIAQRGTGSTFAAINREDLVTLEVPIVPVVEQQRIAQVIRTKLGAVDRVRKASQQRLEAVQALSAAYLREVFEGDKAQSWRWTELAEVASLLPSKSIATNGDTEITTITTACLTERGFDPSGVKTARMRRTDADISLVTAGEVLIARSNTPELVGRVSVFRGDPVGAVASDLTIRIWPGESLDSEFLGYYLSYLFLTGYWRDHAGGASDTMKKITRTQVAAISVPVPDRDTQARIKRYLKGRLAMVERLSQQVADELVATQALVPALLRQAFSGAL